MIRNPLDPLDDLRRDTVAYDVGHLERIRDLMDKDDCRRVFVRDALADLRKHLTQLGVLDPQEVEVSADTSAIGDYLPEHLRLAGTALTGGN